MKLESGRRVYMPSTKTFGTIVRQGGILGLASSYAIVDDVGKKSVFVGDNMAFVYVDSSENFAGEKIDIPPDVVPGLKENFSPSEAKKITEDLYNTSLEDRTKACETISKNTSSKKKPSKKTFEDKRPATRTSKRKS